MDDDAKARDRTYERAEDVANALAAVGDELRDAIADVNSSAEASLGDRDTPLGKAVRVLNNQLQALTNIDARTEELERRLREIHVRRQSGNNLDL